MEPLLLEPLLLGGRKRQRRRIHTEEWKFEDCEQNDNYVLLQLTSDLFGGNLMNMQGSLTKNRWDDISKSDKHSVILKRYAWSEQNNRIFSSRSQ